MDAGHPGRRDRGAGPAQPCKCSTIAGAESSPRTSRGIGDRHLQGGCLLFVAGRPMKNRSPRTTGVCVDQPFGQGGEAIEGNPRERSHLLVCAHGAWAGRLRAALGKMPKAGIPWRTTNPAPAIWCPITRRRNPALRCALGRGQSRGQRKNMSRARACSHGTSAMIARARDGLSAA